MDTMNTTNAPQPQAKSQSDAKVLTRDELAAIQDLFLLDPDNLGFVTGAKAHLSSNNFLFPVLLLLGGLAALILPASVLSGPLVLWRIGGVLALLFGVLAFLGTRDGIRDEQKGKFLPVKLTGVSVKERSATGQAAAEVASFVGGVADEMITKQHHHHRGPDDLYELHLEFSGTTPTGTPFQGKASRNRPDLRNQALPKAGDPCVVMYVTDTNYQLL
jgi:hypothetical protein